MNEEHFLSSWLREDGRELSNENEAERGEKRKREGETEENKTERVKRRCDGFVSVEAFEIFSHSETWRVAVVFRVWISGRCLRTCLILSLILGWMCLWCLMFDVLVSPSFCGH